MMLNGGGAMFGGTSVVTYPGAIGTGLTAGAARLATTVETARQLVSTSAISPALLGGVEAAVAGPGVAGLMLGAGYYALFDFIITRAQQIAADDAQKLAYFNETALLWQEVARREMLSEAAWLAILNVTAGQKTDWSIPSDWDLPKGALVPIAPTGKQPINPNEPNQTPPIVPPIIGLVTATIGVLIDQLSQSQRDELHEAGHTLPSQAPDPNRAPGGIPETPDPGDDEDTVRGLEKQQLNSELMAAAVYVVVNQPKAVYGGLLPSHTQLDPTLNPTKNPDHEIEGRIFDSLAIKETEFANPANGAMNARRKIEIKVEGGQAQRILLNLDDSRLKLEDLKQVLISNPIPNLKEVIIIRNGQIIFFGSRVVKTITDGSARFLTTIDTNHHDDD